MRPVEAPRKGEPGCKQISGESYRVRSIAIGSAFRTVIPAKLVPAKVGSGNPPHRSLELPYNGAVDARQQSETRGLNLSPLRRRSILRSVAGLVERTRGD